MIICFLARVINVTHSSRLRGLPINLTRHFSRPRLCWRFGCRAHPVCGGRRVALWLLHLFFLHRGGCTERVEDDVLVFFPVARLWVRRGFDVALEKLNKDHLAIHCFLVSHILNVLSRRDELTTRFLLQVLDSAGEFGWQLERAGLSGDGVGLAARGDSGSPFSSFDPGWQVGKAPGLREPPTSAGTLQEKERKCCNELKLSTNTAPKR